MNVIDIRRTYDGYVYKGCEIVKRTACALDVQLPGHLRPTRFRRRKANPNRLANDIGDLYCYDGE